MKKNTLLNKSLSTLVLSLSLGFAATAANAQDLTVYTAGPGGLIKTLATGFEAKTGIKVDVFQATTGKVMARLEAEASNPRADILISASWDTATDFDKRGLLINHNSKNAANVPAEFKAPSYVAQGISALGIVWNIDSGKKEPRDWADLATPEYQNAVTMPDPALSGATVDLLLGLQSAKKEEAWKLFQALRANGMTVSGPNAQALTPVLQGAKAAVFGAVDYVSMAGIAQGEKIKVIFPSSGTAIAPRPMMILKSTKHAEAARSFIDYVLSEDGQKAVADAWLMPARSDVAAKRPLFKELKLLPSSDTATASNRAEVLTRFAQIFGQK
jgi:iron(III) transport system substrate-binding protein